MKGEVLVTSADSPIFNTCQPCYNAGTIYMGVNILEPGGPRKQKITGAFVEEVLLNPAQLARAAVDTASDKKASDVLLLDIQGITTIADYFVICSGNNQRQIQAIADALKEELGKQGAKVVHQEGDAASGWVLLDFGDVIVHIFGPKEREYYRLERLWSEAQTVVYLQ